MPFLQNLFDTADFPARWTCGDWSTIHGYAHITADVLIWGAYTAIPLVLAYFISKRRDLPLPNIFWLFCAFIFACGTTHLIEATLFYWPAYRVSGVSKVFTAVVSWATVVALIPATPRALALPGLANVNAALQREITVRQRAEVELEALNRQLESRNQEMREFLSITTHDLKHPVFSVRTLQSLLRRHGYDRLDDEGRQYVDLTLAECDRMMEMLGQLNVLGRIQHAVLEHETHDLRAFLDRCVRRFDAKLETHGCRIDIDAPSRSVTFPRQQVEQALDNLIDNAIKYGCPEEGGTVRVSGKIGAGEAEITVSDQGVGIDPRHHQRVFQLFHRMASEEKGGSGVGLAAVRRLMQRVGGSVTLESQVGQGARFTLRFPIE